MKATPDLAAAALNAMASILNGGTLRYFAGPVPAEAGDALDMVSQHTELVVLSVDGEGNGLTFDAATGGVLPKAASETWSGLVDFDGAQDSETTLTPTFFRFCASGDDGRDAGEGRVQGTIGGPSSSADIRLGDGNTVTANGTNTRALPIFTIEQLFLG